VDDGRRAFQHTQQCKLPFRAGRPSAAGRAGPGPGRPAACPPVSLRDRAAADRGWPMRSLLRLTSDATRESLKCMATQLVNNERKKNCRREYENARPAARQGRQSTGGALRRTNKERFHWSHLGSRRLTLPSGFDRITEGVIGEPGAVRRAEFVETATRRSRCDYVDVDALLRPSSDAVSIDVQHLRSTPLWASFHNACQIAARRPKLWHWVIRRSIPCYQLKTLNICSTYIVTHGPSGHILAP